MSGGPAFRTGSIAWLLAHEFRLVWRGLRQTGRATRRGWVLAAVFLTVTLLAGVPLGLVLRGAVVAIDPVSVVIGDAVLASFLTLMVSASLAAAVEAFYQRGDLDLLLASPIAPRRILTVRAVVICVNVFAGSAVLITPLFLPVALIGHPAWLATYAVLLGMALVATALGLTLSMTLLRVIGPRRTRAAAQVLAAVIGAALFLASQARYLFSDQQVGLAAALITRASRAGGALPAAAVWPLRALLGAPGPIVVLVVVGGLAFAAACAWVGRDFARAAAAAAGTGRAPAKAAGRVRFTANFFDAAINKELRLLSRDVPLISDVVLKLLYLAPLVFIALRGAASHSNWALPSVVAGMTFMTGQVSGSLAWITLSAEDAPDLIAASPVKSPRVRRAKLAAALLPLTVVLAPALGLLLALSPAAGLAAVGGCAAAALAGGLINDWRQSPSKREDFRRRRSGSFLLGLSESVVGALLAGAAGLAAWSTPLAVLPAVLALFALLGMRRSDAAIERDQMAG